MERLFQSYFDLVDFRLVYINEAHPCDGGNPTVLTREKKLYTHASLDARRVAAEKYVTDHNVTIPCLIDELDNGADLAYNAWPDKIYIVRSDGTLALVGADGPHGFPEALEATEKWLQDFRSSGAEPENAELPRSDFRSVVAGEIRPEGPQEELLVQLRQAQQIQQEKEDEKNSSGKTIKTFKHTATADVKEGIRERTESGGKKARVREAASGPIKTWHLVLAGIGLLIAVVLFLSGGSKSKS